MFILNKAVEGVGSLRFEVGAKAPSRCEVFSLTAHSS